LVIGRRPSAVATLVERSSRYVRLVALPHGIKAIPVRIALVDDLNQIEDGMTRTLTWDRGREMADHVRIDRGDRLPGVLLRCPQPLAAGHE
jgi:IS30 family transposase